MPRWVIRVLCLSLLCTSSVLVTACGSDEKCKAGESCQTAGPTCGNGQLESAEQCDDGNTTSGDGCNADCTNGASGSCGNGQLEASEACDDGNTAGLDGCEVDCSVTPANVTKCAGAELAAPASGTCELTAGDGNTLFTAIVLAENGILQGGQVLVTSAGDIACVGCDCSGAAGAATATRLVCPGGVLSPGLINAHDHITFQAAPYKDTTGERYEHRHDWREGKDGHTKISNGGTAGNASIRWGELRQVLSGTTSVAGSGGQNGLLRNLDKASTAGSGGSQEALGEGVVKYETFPLGDSGGQELATGCGYPSVDDASVIPADAAYLPHIAEGIEQSARNELLCLSGAEDTGKDVLSPRTAIIHGIGVTAADINRISSKGTSLIWSPRSNVALYGNTAPVTTYARLGTKIALGTDWVRSGSMNVLRELKCADYLNQSFYGKYFSDEALWRMATSGAADATQVGEKLGRIAEGKTADLALFRARPGSPYRSVISANPEDVVLTVRGGRALFGDDALITAMGQGECDTLDVCGVQKRVCLKSETGETVAQLRSTVEADFTKAKAPFYDLFYCGTPTDEPVCSPVRAAQWSVAGSTTYSGTAAADDVDADGIVDGQDNCPRVFNPVRPMDQGQQADGDADGEGDVCDLCPLDADSTSCAQADPNDSDRDGKANAEDNCPNEANPDQADTDGDAKGNVCDACPTANPGAQACTVSLYDVKKPDSQGKHPFMGQRVRVRGLLVTGLVRPVGTATTSGGFYAQLVSGDSTQGADYSGVFVFAPGHTVKVGDRVDVDSATVTDFFGQLQLAGNPVLVVTSSGNPAPAPLLVSPQEVATGGARAAALEGVLVRVNNVNVTQVAPPAGAGDRDPTNEFEVTGPLRVDDYLYLVTPFPTANESFLGLVGVLTWRNGNSKLEPRGAADVIRGLPTLTSLGPDGGFIRAGQTGTTLSPALTVSLSSAAQSDTIVSITSSDSTALSVVGGGVTIPTGQTSAPVQLQAGAASATVTLTASLAGETRTATVRVLSASDVPAIAALECGAGAPAGGTVPCTVRLTLPSETDLELAGPTVDPAGFATGPAAVTVLAHQLSATFSLGISAAATGTATVTFTHAGVSFTAPLAVFAGDQGLVINEIDYDQTAADTAEFVELLNTSAQPVSLAGLKLVFVNGAASVTDPTKREYFPAGGTGPGARISLDAAGATLAPGQFLVVANKAVYDALPATALKILLPDNTLQNGAPDAVGIYNPATASLIDSLSYEGAASASLDGKLFDFREGTADTTLLVDTDAGSKSLTRVPNGTDTQVNATDFVVSSAPSPGSDN